MTANQRLVVMLYAMHPTDRAGAVIETGAKLAELVGMSPTVFSRTRRQVVEAGWLEESERLAHILPAQREVHRRGRRRTPAPRNLNRPENRPSRT